jgi:hypothetical protein
MKNHTRTAQNTNHGSLETPTSLNAKPDFETFDSFAAKLTQAKIEDVQDEDGLPFVETDEKIIYYYLKKPSDRAEFEKTGYFVMNGVKVKKRGE